MKKIKLKINECILLLNTINACKFSITEMLVISNINNKINIFNNKEIVEKHNVRLKYDDNNNVIGIEWSNGDGEREYEFTEDEIKIFKKSIEELEKKEGGLPIIYLDLVNKIYNN